MKIATYSLLTLRPDPERVDVLCVGALVLDADGVWHAAVPPNQAKLLAFNGERGAAALSGLVKGLQPLLAECVSMEAARALFQQLRSSLSVHGFEGKFAYASESEFTGQLQAVMRESVLVQPLESTAAQTPQRRVVRQHTRARLRRQFESMGIMGTRADEIADHKVVRNFPVSAQHGLTAEFALKNSVMHITETVDFEVADESVRGKIYEAQAKCLILQKAREHFGSKTECYVVVSGSGAEHASRSVDLLSTAGRLFAAENAEDMQEYLDRIARAARATPQLRELPAQ